MKRWIGDRFAMRNLRRTAWRACFVLSVPGMTGCALMQPTDPLVPVADVHGPVAAVDAAVAAEPFAEASIDQPLGLQDCMALALAHNPAIRQGYWKAAADCYWARS